MVIRGSVWKSGISALVLAICIAPASAQEATAVANRIKSLMAEQGTDISWASISGEGSEFTLEGVKAKTGQSGEYVIGDVDFEGVEEANGGYKIGLVTMPDYEISETGLDFAMSGATVENLIIPAEGSTDPLAKALFYESADVESITVGSGDTEYFSLANLNITMTPPAGGQAMTFSASAPEMNADLSAIDDPATQQMVKALGYEQASGSITMAGTWNPADGKIVISQYDTKMDNAGTLGVTFDIGGYTIDFMKQLADLQKKMAAQPGGGDSAQGMAMLGLMQQLVFNGAAIRFTDDSLTSKLLDYYAKQQGTDSKSLIMQVKALVPFGMAQLNNPELTAQVSAAVSTFLDDPKSLTITAKPAAPTPFAQIMAAGMGDPMALPKTLGLTVAAND